MASAASAFEIARIDELADARGWSSIRRHFGIQAFGVNAVTARKPGDRLVSEHDEVRSGHEELFLVVAGRATFTLDGAEVDAPAGTLVFVRDPAAKRGAVGEAGTIVLAVGGTPGEAFRPRAWETNVEVGPMFDEGRYDEIKRVLTDALDRYEDRGGILYNLACAEAQLGETDAAVEHLRAALADRPDLAEGAREDADFAAIRADPRFAEVVGS